MKATSVSLSRLKEVCLTLFEILLNVWICLEVTDEFRTLELCWSLVFTAVTCHITTPV